MAHYGDDKAEFTSSNDEDSDELNEYFDPKPRRIDFDHSDVVDQNIDGDDVSEENVSKSKKKKLPVDEADLVCDICKKTFDKRWALNSHMLVHSGLVFHLLVGMLESYTMIFVFSVKPFRCTFKTCTKQYADR